MHNEPETLAKIIDTLSSFCTVRSIDGVSSFSTSCESHVCPAAGFQSDQGQELATGANMGV